MSEQKVNTKKTVKVGAREINIPDDWDLSNLHDLIDISGSGEWGEEVETDTNNNQALVLRSGDITLDGKLSTKDIATRYLSEKDYTQHAIEPLDIVIVSSSGSKRHIGKKWLAPEKIDQNKYHFTNFLYRIRLDKSKCSATFIYYFLCSDHETAFLQSISPTSTGLQNLDTDSYEDLTIPFPPLPEQYRVADILSTVDEQIHQTEEMIEHTRDLKQGLRQDILLKGVDQQNYKHIQLGPKEFEIPKQWSVKQISDVCDDIIDYRGKTPTYSDSGIPHIRNFNIEENRLVMDDIEYVSEDTYDEWMTRGIPKEGDVFFTTEAPLGKAAMVPEFKFSLAQRLVVLQPGEKITGKYLMYLLTSDFMKKYYHTRATGSTVKGLSNRALQKVKILVPSIEEQSKITACLSNVDSKLYKEMEYLENLKELKRGLMQDLITGKVRVDTD